MEPEDTHARGRERLGSDDSAPLPDPIGLNVVLATKKRKRRKRGKKTDKQSQQHAEEAMRQSEDLWRKIMPREEAGPDVGVQTGVLGELFAGSGERPEETSQEERMRIKRVSTVQLPTSNTSMPSSIGKQATLQMPHTNFPRNGLSFSQKQNNFTNTDIQKTVPTYVVATGDPSPGTDENVKKRLHSIRDTMGYWNRTAWTMLDAQVLARQVGLRFPQPYESFYGGLK